MRSMRHKQQCSRLPGAEVETFMERAERGKSFHLCLTSFCEISQELVGWFLFVWWVVLCWFAFQ